MCDALMGQVLRQELCQVVTEKSIKIQHVINLRDDEKMLG